MENYDPKIPDNRTRSEREDDKTTGYILAAVGVIVVLGAVFFMNRSDNGYDYRTAPQTTAPAAPANTAPDTTRPNP
jgi:hypothetical protein